MVARDRIAVLSVMDMKSVVVVPCTGGVVRRGKGISMVVGEGMMLTVVNEEQDRNRLFIDIGVCGLNKVTQKSFLYFNTYVLWEHWLVLRHCDDPNMFTRDHFAAGSFQ